MSAADDTEAAAPGDHPADSVDVATPSDIADGEPDRDALAGDHPADDATAADPSDASAADQREPIDVEALIDDLSRVTGERDGYLADLQRVSAEFANFRRQNDKRQQEVVQQAAARLAEALLPVLDACEAAVQQGVDGVEPVKGQLLGVLEREGLEVVDTADDPFDPNRHDAVMHEPAEDGDDGESVVAEVLRTGYVWNGKVLRPAMVRVRG